MKNISLRLGVIVTAIATLLFIRLVDAQVDPGRKLDQRPLAQQLLSDDETARNEALLAARSIDRSKFGPELRAALITVLDKNNGMARAASQRGEAVERVLNPDFHARVCQTVTELRDPSTIPVLAGSLGACGWVIHRDLASFGEQAAPAVIAVVTSPQSSYDAVNEGLIALRFMVENRDQRPLSATSLKGIRRAAEFHLNAPGRPPGTGVTLRWAIDLAVALGDPGLTRIVETLASDSAALIARGITDPQLIDDTKKWAADRLAGVPPLPR
jgi:hypothetical protein